MQRHAFSLVELSIVLVILGLLTGGILAGQSLIRAAELRAVSSEYNRYTAALHTFRDKYFALPGDMTNATSFWGKSAALCNADAGAAQVPGTCNGNGDGWMIANAVANTKSEIFANWQQLALAGLIEGTYDGISGPGTGHTSLASNSPKSRFGSGYWMLYSYGSVTFTGNASIYDGRYDKNYFGVGGLMPNTSAEEPIIKAEELWNIDTKLDDGKPGQGKVQARYPIVCSTVSSTADRTGEYRLSTNPLCVPAITFE